jgi:hypothetical protein
MAKPTIVKPDMLKRPGNPPGLFERTETEPEQMVTAPETVQETTVEATPEAVPEARLSGGDSSQDQSADAQTLTGEQPTAAPGSPLDVGHYPTLTCRVPPEQYQAFIDACRKLDQKPGYLLAWLVEHDTPLLAAGTLAPPADLSLPGRKRKPRQIRR